MTLLEPTPAPSDNGPSTLCLPGQRTLDIRAAAPVPPDTESDGRPEGPRDARMTRDDAIEGDTIGTAAGGEAGRRDRFPALRFGRVRVLSLAKVAAVFSVVGFLVTVGTITVLWNVLVRVGLVASAEDAAATALGLDDFVIEGGDWFWLVVVGSGALFVFSLFMTVLLALVYNATCALFGGVAIEARPVRRPPLSTRLIRRVRSLRS